MNITAFHPSLLFSYAALAAVLLLARCHPPPLHPLPACHHTHHIEPA